MDQWSELSRLTHEEPRPLGRGWVTMWRVLLVVTLLLMLAGAVYVATHDVGWDVGWCKDYGGETICKG